MALEPNQLLSNRYRVPLSPEVKGGQRVLMTTSNSFQGLRIYTTLFIITHLTMSLKDKMRFEVLMAVKMLMLAFWVIMLCGLVGRHQRFGGTYLQG
jgi:hypothetical protein